MHEIYAGTQYTQLRIRSPGDIGPRCARDLGTGISASAATVRLAQSARTPVANASTKADVRDSSTAGLRVNPGRGHPQQLGDPVCRRTGHPDQGPARPLDRVPVNGSRRAAPGVFALTALPSLLVTRLGTASAGYEIAPPQDDQCPEIAARSGSALARGISVERCVAVAGLRMAKAKRKSSKSTRDKRAARSKAARIARRRASHGDRDAACPGRVVLRGDACGRSAVAMLDRLQGGPAPAGITRFFAVAGSEDRARAITAEVAAPEPNWPATALALAADVAISISTATSTRRRRAA